MDSTQLNTFRFFLEAWLEETGIRCTEVLEKYTSIGSAGDLKGRAFDEHYALTAATMSRRFATKLHPHASKAIKPAIEAFLQNTKLVETVRDMREHSDAYFTGKGRNQDEFLTCDELALGDMSSTIARDEGYMLGNVFAVECITGESANLLKELRTEVSQYS